MAPSRRLSNGRSPLVNQQRQITSFFSKFSSSDSPSPAVSKHCTEMIPNPIPGPSSTPSPTTPSPIKSRQKKPRLVIGPSLYQSPATPALNKAETSKKNPYGYEAVGKKIRVYWPLDQSWYEGFVKSFDKASGNHLVQYNDSDEEILNLLIEKIQWVEESSPDFCSLKRPLVVTETITEEGLVDDVSSSGDDSIDEDWGKNVADDAEESFSDDMELESVVEEDKGPCSSMVLHSKLREPTKKVTSSGKPVVNRKRKNSEGDLKNGIKILNNNVGTLVETTGTEFVDSSIHDFGSREAEKLHFIGKNRKDGFKRCPGDENYDPKTLYLPPDFLKSLSGGQRQWWNFKSKHMDKVLFFKMGKFYELFEMDAHVGASELGLQYMKGEQPHCGFPEKNFSTNVEKLTMKGFRVLVVEQTETPDQLELRRKEKGSKDKVVNREICALVTKGTLTEGEMLSANPEASYLMAITETCGPLLDQNVKRLYGVCLADVATNRVILGQFGDDLECNALCCLLTELRPVEIIKPSKLLTPETERAIIRHTRSPLVNELVPLLEFWDAGKTISEIKKLYSHSVDGYSVRCDNDVCTEKEDLRSLPDVLSKLFIAGEGGSYALSALGGILFYLKQAFLDESFLRFGKFELLPCSAFRDITQNPYMILDSATLENLEIFENSQNGDSSGTLYAQLNHCMTAFGKRLLKTWLARPLINMGSIKERQDAVAGLKGENLPFALEFRKALSTLPDMERLLARLFASSEASGRNANKVVMYENASKKQLLEFISALRGCELMVQSCFSLGVILDNVNSELLNYLLTAGTSLADINSVVLHFKDAFDWVEASNSGCIIPRDGVVMEYDFASKKVKEMESNLAKHLKEQRKLLKDESVNFVTVGKERYLLEIPERLRKQIPQNYELRSSKKGFFRYWNPSIQGMLGELSRAEFDKESKLKSILQQLLGDFCKHHQELRKLVAAIAELDVLISLAIASDYYEGPTCRPLISELSSSNEMPYYNARCLGHPVFNGDSLGRGAFVPNDIIIGGSANASFILLTGPNMGGKSTLLRQACLAVILAQVGADVPAERFEMSPVDRIFVRMGAKDHIMDGRSTFLTELSETAHILSSATRNSVVALDELGRGTSTSDGQAIAEAVLEHLVHKVHCRGFFSTHYHRLAINYENDPEVSLWHMGCRVGKGMGEVEEVTFLYKLTAGACPKSYGVNVARLAGLPESVLESGGAKSREFEGVYGKTKDGMEMESWAREFARLLGHCSQEMEIRFARELQVKAMELLLRMDRLFYQGINFQAL